MTFQKEFEAFQCVHSTTPWAAVSTWHRGQSAKIVGKQGGQWVFRWENSLGKECKRLEQAWPWEAGSICPFPPPLQHLIYMKGQILLCHNDVNAKYYQAVCWSELDWEKSRTLTVFHQYNSEHIFYPWVEPLHLKFLSRGGTFSHAVCSWLTGTVLQWCRQGRTLQFTPPDPCPVSSVSCLCFSQAKILTES